MKNRSDLADIQISGIQHVDALLSEGRDEEARNLYISGARAVWQSRWQSKREYSLQLLGEALDTVRYPNLLPIAESLCREEPEAAGQFLEYLRNREKRAGQPAGGRIASNEVRFPARIAMV